MRFLLLVVGWASAAVAAAPLSVHINLNGGESVTTAPVSLPIAAEGKPLLPVVIGEKASAETKSTAQKMAAVLGRIIGGEVQVKTGDGSEGIIVGVAGDFPQVFNRAAETSFAEPETYSLITTQKAAIVIAYTESGLRDAVWDFLSRCGYRQYFPGKTWEIVPREPNLTLTMGTLQQPAYLGRRIWYGYGSWNHDSGAYEDWCEKNRCVNGVEIAMGHAYDGILSRNKAAFAAHPEYLGLVKGERKSSKFCVSNPGLRKLVADDAVAQLDKDPARHTISIEPSDGGGWCECAECAKLGSITDRAVLLANTAAESVTLKYPGTLVGMYAYNEHSPAPSIAVHPAVVVGIATGFIKGGFTVDQLLDGWSAKAKTLGIREYYSVNTWDRDRPGAARGSNLDYLAKTIPHFAEKHARFMSAESSENWGPNGLGYYLAARMLWDPREAQQIDKLKEEFLTNCFGPAAAAMRKFYALLDGSKPQQLSDDLLGRMYRLLDEARARSHDAGVSERLDALTLYTRYVELYSDYSAAQGPARQKAFEALLRHAYRMRDTHLVHSYALWRDLVHRDKAVSMPTEAAYTVPEGKNPWKSSEPFTREELTGFMTQGITQRKLLDFEPVSFSEELVRPTALNLPKVKPGSVGLYSRAPRVYYTIVDKAPATIELTMKAGIIYQTAGPAKVDLYPAGEAEGKSVAHAEVAPDRAEHVISLTTTFTGLHRIEIASGGATSCSWPEGTPMTVQSSSEHPGQFHGRWTLYFYVPRGTKIVGGFSEGAGKLRDGKGAEVLSFEQKAGYYSVPVAPGQDGALWSFDNCAGDKTLMTVPPYLARSAEELLLPQEVVEKH